MKTWLYLLLFLIPVIAFSESPANAQNEMDKRQGEENATFEDDSGQSQDDSASTKLMRELKEKFHLKLYLDFLYEASLGSDDDTSTREADNASFSSNHTYLLINANPSDNIRVGFDIQFREYYEIEYLVTHRLSFKGGKIFLPFGDFAYHPIYGGKVYSLDNDLFPNWFTDFGLAVRHNFLDGDYFNMTYEGFVSNGFQNASEGDINMNDIGFNNDNNDEKAVGGRIKTSALGRYNFTGSIMYDQWSDTGDATLLLWAADISTSSGIAKLPILKHLNARAGYLGKHIENDDAAGATLQDYDGAGIHLELSARPLRWLKLVYRVGAADPNDNVRDELDQRNHNLSTIFSVDEHLDIWVMYQRNEEKYVDEIDNDYFAIKAVLQY